MLALALLATFGQVVPQPLTAGTGVTLRTAQTIAGQKTFTATLLLSADLNVAGNDINGTGTTATLRIKSSAADAFTSATEAAITLQAGTDITATDLVLNVEDSAGTNILVLREDGRMTGSVLALTGGVLELNSTAGEDLRLSTSAASASATDAALRIYPFNALDADDLMLKVANTGGARLASIDYEGDVVAASSFRSVLKTLDTCAAGIEGALQMDALSGVATGKRTKLCLCTSDGASTYVWQNVVTGTLGVSSTVCGTE